MDELINNLSTYGYIILFFYSLGGGFLALAAAGVLASMGKMEIEASIVVAIAANFIGDQMLFLMARYNKHQFMQYLKKHRRKLAYSHLLMRRFGSWIVLLQKFIYGVKTLVPIAIGLTRYNAGRFGVLNFFSAIIWGVAIGLGGYLGGKSILSLLERTKENPWVLPAIGLGIIVLTYLFFKKVTDTRR